MLNNDFNYSKLQRFLGKKPDELHEVIETLKLYYKDIKKVFDHLAGLSNYPTIGMLDFGDFCR